MLGTAVFVLVMTTARWRLGRRMQGNFTQQMCSAATATYHRLEADRGDQ